MSNRNFNFSRKYKRVGPTQARLWPGARPGRDLVATVATIGMVAAGAALFEAALIPGLMIGGAAVLAPRYLSTLRKRLRPISTPPPASQSSPRPSRWIGPRSRDRWPCPPDSICSRRWRRPYPFA